MRKLVVSICVILCILCCSCTKKEATIQKSINTSECEQPGAYFPTDEERYILVDQAYQTIGDETYLCKVFADKYMLTMYLWIQTFGSTSAPSASMTQILYEDGSPMIYDAYIEE